MREVEITSILVRLTAFSPCIHWLSSSCWALLNLVAKET